MKLFLGDYDHALDDRGRITLPRKVRVEIGFGQVVLSRGFDKCIFGFDLVSWEKEAGKHLESQLTDDEGRNLRRYLFAAAEKVDTDKLGRILVPTHLKEYAGLKASVKVIGAGDHFEIWDKEIWKEFEKSQNHS
ncbi:division/cell wall cluster transcriptional repressor MraZ [Patescibacteria group bacterium]